MKREWATPIVQELNVSETTNILGHQGYDSYTGGINMTLNITGLGDVPAGS